MNGHGTLLDIFYLLLAAVIFVPMSQRSGLGIVLGYLLAGLAVGPWGLGLIKDTENIRQVSEFGVVFLLFVIGLELEPRRLWSFRVPIFGMGSAQIALVTLLVTALGLAAGFAWKTGLVAGLGLALSSTAIAVQLLQGRNLMKTRGGSSAFSILLFQDVAVIPIMAVLPILAGASPETPSEPLWKILLVVAIVAVVGHQLFRYVLRSVASTHLRELSTALSLLLVIGLAVLMRFLGLSMSMGAFMGGVLLATSEYRHAIETDLEPFRGLLLGLFFMSVGMTIDLGAIGSQPFAVILLLAGLLLVKLIVQVAIAFVFRLEKKEVPFFALVLTQVGEFAFVLFAQAGSTGILSNQEATILTAAAALSMATTPLLALAYDKWIAPRLELHKDMSSETVQDDQPEVIIAGFGRVGQIIARLLYANRIRATVLDHDPEQIETLRQFGFKIYYGDATRLDLLEAAGAARARILVIAVDDADDCLRIVDLAKEHFPQLRLVARARNVAHAYQLIDRGVSLWERETFDSSLRMATEVLKLLGWPAYQAVRAGHRFRHHNLRMIQDLHKQREDRSSMLSTAKQARVDLENMFAGELENLRKEDHVWEQQL